MIEQLFGSKTRVKLLQLFYANPNRAFYVREITRKIDEQINSVRRELSNLLAIGLITSETNNNRLYYEVNQSYEYYQPLSAVFGGKKTKKSAKARNESDDAQETEEIPVPADEDPMLKLIRSAGRVDMALLTGQFTRDSSSGVDLLIVGDINQTKAAKVIAELEDKERKTINYTIMTTKDYLYRLQVHDRFLNNVLASKKQVIANESGLTVET